MINLKHLISDVPVEFLKWFDMQDSIAAGRQAGGGGGGAVHSHVSCKWPARGKRRLTELPTARGTQSDVMFYQRERLLKERKALA